MFIIPKHVFNDLSYATTISNSRSRKWLKMSLALVINFMMHDINFNKITFVDWSKMFIMPKHVFYDLSYVII
jgi:hypothetical protein